MTPVGAAMERPAPRGGAWLLRRLLAGALCILLPVPALCIALAGAYMVLDFPPFHMIDEGGHLHAVAALAEGRLPRVGEALDRRVMALAIGAPENAPELPPAPRYFLLHPPAYYLLAAPWFALGGGSWRAGLTLVRLFSALALFATAIAIPWWLLREGRRRGAGGLDVRAGAVAAMLPLAMPGVIFASAFATNHLLDVVLGSLLGVASAGVLFAESDGGDRRTAARRLVAVALIGGLLAATRLTNVWAIGVPLGLALLADRRHAAWIAGAVAGLLPGIFLVALWCADNLVASGSLVPAREADAIVREAVGPAGLETPPWRLAQLPFILAGEVLVGQGKRPRWLGEAAIWATALALVAWAAASIAPLLAGRWRRAATAGPRRFEPAPRAARARAALLALYGLGGNVAMVAAVAIASGVPRLVGRYLLTGTCFAFAVVGTSIALGAARAGAGDREEDRAGGERPAVAPFLRAGAVLVLAALVIAAWAPPWELTPPRWGEPLGDRPPALLERLFGRPA